MTDPLESTRKTSGEITINTAGGVYVGGDVFATTFVGRDLYNYYFIGLAPLVHDPTRRFRNFLNEYLGTPEHHVPFGGRQAQLDELNAWLNDSDAPPYYLMTAEAGRGKSALVCRWMEELRQQRADVAVVFIPISIRFETAAQDVVFAALAARLAKLYDEPLQPAAHSGAQWQGVCESYLDRTPPAGKQLVVILDGLDEATGWSIGVGFFSTSPPPGLRVLVTARSRVGESTPQGWAATLGWHDRLTSMATLLPLTRTGLEEALVSMGNPLEALVNKTEIVQQLYRLTEGDPLLVRLYIQALEKQKASIGSLNTEDLKKLTPGLQGYFDQWWKGQKEQWRAQGRDPEKEEANLRLLLDAMSAAFGPLTLDDLAQLHPELGSSRLVRVLLQSVERWVVGNGKEQGYSYSHARLGYYFWEQLSRQEQVVWDGSFCVWGATTLAALNAEQLDPKVAPVYLLRHYANHLQRSHAPAEAFYALVSNGWRKAWEKLDVSYGGFLGDVERAWERANQAYDAHNSERAEALVQQMRAALCRSSVAALSSNISPELLGQLVTNGLRTPIQALAIVKLVPDEQRRAKMLAILVEHLPADLLEDALHIARAIRRYDSCAVALSALVPYLSENERNKAIDEALSASSTFGLQDSRARIISALAPYLSTPKLTKVLREALDIAQKHEHDYTRACALGLLVPHLLENEREKVIEEALNIARIIESAPFRVDVLSLLAPHLSERAKGKVLEEALSIARAIEFGCSRAKALASLVPYLTESKRAKVLEEALSAVPAIWMRSSCADALVALAPYLPADLLERALQTASAIWDESDRARALAALVPYLPESIRMKILAQVFAVARAIGDVSPQTDMLGALAPYLPTYLIGEALSLVRAIEREDFRATALSTLAPRLSDNLLGEALAAARAIEHEPSRAEALIALGSRVPESEQRSVFEDALYAARTFEYEFIDADLLVTLVLHISERERGQVISEILSATRMVANESIYANFLSAIVPHLPETERSKALEQALGVAHKIKDKPSHVSVLLTLAKCMAETERIKVLEDALSTTSMIDYEVSQSTALITLAPHLSDTLLDEAFNIAGGIKYKLDRSNAMGTLVSYMDPGSLAGRLITAQALNDESLRASILIALLSEPRNDGQSKNIEAILLIARSIGFASLSAAALRKFVSRLSNIEQGIVLREAVISIAESIWVSSSRADKLKTLASPLSIWASQQPKESHSTFAEVLSILAVRPRPEFINDLAILMPFILALAGDEAPEAAEGIFHAIQEVCGWWP